MDDTETSAEITILVRGAGQNSAREDELVYCAGVTDEGQWMRLVPVTFKKPMDAKQFRRFDRVRFRYKPHASDGRGETVRLVPHSMEIIGDVPVVKRREFLDALELKTMASLNDGERTLALLKPIRPTFSVQKKNESELRDETRLHAVAGAQATAYALPPGKSVRPFSYRFHYKLPLTDGVLECVYREWEMNERFSNLAESFGEPQTLARVVQSFGREHPERGMYCVVAREPGKTWEVHAVIGMDEVEERSGALNLTV